MILILSFLTFSRPPLVKNARTSAQGLALETFGITVQGAQTVCHGSLVTFTQKSNQFFLCQSCRIGSTTFGGCGFNVSLIMTMNDDTDAKDEDR